MSKQLQTLRSKIAALQQERAVLLGQERSRAEVEAYVREYAQRAHAEFEERARLALRRVATGDGGAALDGAFRGAAMQYGATTVSAPLVGIVGPDAIAEALLRHIDAVPEGKDAAARAPTSPFRISSTYARPRHRSRPSTRQRCPDWWW